MAGRTLWIRSDGSAATGLGHLSRCTTLAEEAAGRGWPVRFVSRPDPVAARFLEARYQKVRWLEGASSAWASAVVPGDVALFDGYHLTAADSAPAAEAGATTVWLDDTGRSDLVADLAIDPNDPDAQPPAGAHVGRWLAGPRYALVRASFRRRRRAERRGHTLVVTFGGSDPMALGRPIAAAVVSGGRFDPVLLVEGPASLPTSKAPPGVTVLRDPVDVAGTFDRAVAAVAAAGSTCWELCCLGIPAVLVAVADNQRSVARTAARAGAALVATEVEDVVTAVAQLADPMTRTTMAAAALELVDGQGAARLMDELGA
jgi:spore coat polysaccharide biosynthesis predicted glycosyltransferase SpsG